MVISADSDLEAASLGRIGGRLRAGWEVGAAAEA
jgi:hypothetical protein